MCTGIHKPEATAQIEHMAFLWPSASWLWVALLSRVHLVMSETFLIVTTGGSGIMGKKWGEAKDAAKQCAGRIPQRIVQYVKNAKVKKKTLL